jgi:CheY-like chemotaxis protein
MDESKPLKIVLIDDDDIQNLVNRKIIHLEHPQVQVVSYSDAKSALDAVTKELPDLILLDINMPRMNGWDFLEVFKNGEKTCPVIILTSSLNNMDKDKSKEYACVTGFISKPLKTEKVKEVLSGLD